MADELPLAQADKLDVPGAACQPLPEAPTPTPTLPLKGGGRKLFPSPSQGGGQGEGRLVRKPKKHRIRPKILKHARELRGELTPAEKKLWGHLRGGNLDGFTFRHQHCIGQFIVDFYCARAYLVVEIDGDTHDGRESYDAARTRTLEKAGNRVIRFTNTQVHEQMALVLEAILSACKRGVPPPPRPSL